MSLTVLSIFGTRPEAVKMAPVIKALESHADKITSITCVTGQHREMLAPILEIFEIDPQYDLDVMRSNQGLIGSLTRLLSELDSVVTQTNPDWILAQGDTTTVLASAITAYYHRVSFGHIEAGLRTGDKYSPYPEEGNRLLADAISDVYFAPTETSRQALLRENVADERILVTGNTVVDALMDIVKRPFESAFLNQLPKNKRLVLVTAHRRESFGDTFKQLCYAIQDIAQRFDDVYLIYPVHLNPNVQKPVYDILGNQDNILLTDPLPYAEMIHLMQRCELILTDSGGIQEEAPTFEIPLLIMRDKTERTEGVDAGIAQLVGTSRAMIVDAATAILNGTKTLSFSSVGNPYGDGKAAQRIVEYLLKQASYE